MATVNWACSTVAASSASFYHCARISHKVAGQQVVTSVSLTAMNYITKSSAAPPKQVQQNKEDSEGDVYSAQSEAPTQSLQEGHRWFQ